MSTVGILLALFAYRDACYLAGVAAARECLPVEESGPSQWAKGSNDCRELTLANLRTLEEGLKEPSLCQRVRK